MSRTDNILLEDEAGPACAAVVFTVDEVADLDLESRRFLVQGVQRPYNIAKVKLGAKPAVSEGKITGRKGETLRIDGIEHAL